MVLGVYLYTVILIREMSKLFYNDDSNRSKTLFGSWSFNKTNYFLLFSGILLIILGYFIMAYGEVNSFQSLTLAPIILFIGYIILIPSALIYRGKDYKKRLKFGIVVQLVRTPACQAGGREFKSRRSR